MAVSTAGILGPEYLNFGHPNTTGKSVAQLVAELVAEKSATVRPAAPVMARAAA